MKNLFIAAVVSIAVACPLAYADEPMHIQSVVAAEGQEKSVSQKHRRHHRKQGRRHEKARRHHQRADDGKRQHGEQPDRETSAERKIDQETELNNR